MYFDDGLPGGTVNGPPAPTSGVRTGRTPCLSISTNSIKLTDKYRGSSNGTAPVAISDSTIANDHTSAASVTSPSLQIWSSPTPRLCSNVSGDDQLMFVGRLRFSSNRSEVCMGRASPRSASFTRRSAVTIYSTVARKTQRNPTFSTCSLLT